MTAAVGAPGKGVPDAEHAITAARAASIKQGSNALPCTAVPGAPEQPSGPGDQQTLGHTFPPTRGEDPGSPPRDWTRNLCRAHAPPRDRTHGPGVRLNGREPGGLLHRARTHDLRGYCTGEKGPTGPSASSTPHPGASGKGPEQLGPQDLYEGGVGSRDLCPRPCLIVDPSAGQQRSPRRDWDPTPGFDRGRRCDQRPPRGEVIKPRAAAPSQATFPR